MGQPIKVEDPEEIQMEDVVPEKNSDLTSEIPNVSTSEDANITSGNRNARSSGASNPTLRKRNDRYSENCTQTEDPWNRHSSKPSKSLNNIPHSSRNKSSFHENEESQGQGLSRHSSYRMKSRGNIKVKKPSSE